jgi:hypothetical protein
MKNKKETRHTINHVGLDGLLNDGLALKRP